MRQLDEKERKVTEKGIERIQDEIIDLQDSLDYNRALKEKEQYLRNFDDTWRDILRKKKDESDKQLLDQMSEMIKEKERTINIMNKHLTEGVEEKIPLGVQ